MRLDRRWLVAGIMAVCVITIALTGKKAGVDQGASENASGQEAQEQSVSGGSDVQNATGALETGPVLDEDQKEMLDYLYGAMEEGRYEEAAREMLEHEQKLQYLFYQVMDGTTYLYHDGALTEELEGTGLVLRKPTAVFYGAFQNGKPEGEGAAVQVVELGDWRYDYSVGTWKDGKMEGQGETGYHYYNGVTSEESQSMRKTGNFTGDLMDGAVEYQVMNDSGESTVWNLKADHGVTVLDENWIYEEEIGEYHLMSNDNQKHVYVVPKADQDKVLWRNLQVWEE